MQLTVISITAMPFPLAYTASMTTFSKADRIAWLQGPSGHCDVVPDGSSAPWMLVLLGAPGVGKGTQAALLHERLGSCHLSTGDVFRHAGTRPECDQSPAMREAMAYMLRGELVPDSTVWELVRERKACLHCRGGFILDGFPRTVPQARALTVLFESLNITPDAVINMDIDESEVVNRLGNRLACTNCGRIFNAVTDHLKSGAPCPACGGQLSVRDDDKPETVRKRLHVYRSTTMPVKDYYEQLGLLKNVHASGDIEHINDAILRILRAD